MQMRQTKPEVWSPSVIPYHSLPPRLQDRCAEVHTEVETSAGPQAGHVHSSPSRPEMFEVLTEKPAVSLGPEHHLTPQGVKAVRLKISTFRTASQQDNGCAAVSLQQIPSSNRDDGRLILPSQWLQQVQPMTACHRSPRYLTAARYLGLWCSIQRATGLSSHVHTEDS